MKAICRIICCSMMLILLINSIGSVSALTYDGITLEETEVPANIDFTTHSTCSGHACFWQASAYEDGSFAIYTHNLADSDASEPISEIDYIDIYDANGEFVEEVSIVTSFDFAIEKLETSINFYSYTGIMTYDYITKELHYYDLPDSVDVQPTILALREKTFICGDWEYSYTKSPVMGYKKLIRSNENGEETLIDFPGLKELAFKLRIGQIIGLVVFTVGIVAILISGREKKRDDAQKTGDGSLS